MFAEVSPRTSGSLLPPGFTFFSRQPSIARTSIIIFHGGDSKTARFMNGLPAKYTRHRVPGPSSALTEFAGDRMRNGPAHRSLFLGPSNHYQGYRNSSCHSNRGIVTSELRTFITGHWRIFVEKVARNTFFRRDVT